MPELPEVETTRRGLKKAIEGNQVANVIIRERALRWPIPQQLAKTLPGQIVQSLTRRAKYLLFNTHKGSMIMHLGMSGRVHLLQHTTDAAKHDHVDIEFNNGLILRYTDPRRFGCILWTHEDVTQHKLIKHLGPEPLGKQFNANYLYNIAKKRKINCKQLLMNNQIVVGVGNIYATEALFMAHISPLRPSYELNHPHCTILVKCIQSVLKKAIKAGGTTLKDFYQSNNKPGYFKQQLQVYGQQGSPCPRCHQQLCKVIIATRSTVYCKYCQT